VYRIIQFILSFMNILSGGKAFKHLTMDWTSLFLRRLYTVSQRSCVSYQMYIYVDICFNRELNYEKCNRILPGYKIWKKIADVNTHSGYLLCIHVTHYHAYNFTFVSFECMLNGYHIFVVLNIYYYISSLRRTICRKYFLIFIIVYTYVLANLYEFAVFANIF